jgi:hypothetical protein
MIEDYKSSIMNDNQGRSSRMRNESPLSIIYYSQSRKKLNLYGQDIIDT